MRTLMLVIALLGAVAAPSAAQHLPVQAGDRVRLAGQTPRDAEVTANILAVAPEGLSLAVEGTNARLDRSYSSIGLIRVSEGKSRSRSALRGALWGVWLAGGAGLVSAPLAAEDMEMGVGASMMRLGGGGALIGAGVGAVLGAILAREEWKSYILQKGR